MTAKIHSLIFSDERSGLDIQQILDVCKLSNEQYGDITVILPVDCIVHDNFPKPKHSFRTKNGRKIYSGISPEALISFVEPYINNQVDV